MYDLIVRGGRVLDPASGLRGQYDIAVQDGKIAAIRPSLDVRQARRVVQVTGKLVTPGLIDAHTHVYAGVMRGGVDPDLAGVRAGVTTVVDAGSAGSHTVLGLQSLVLPRARTRVVPLLNIARTGLAFMPEARGREDIDLEATLRAVEESRGGIRGIKVRAIGPAAASLGLDLVRLAQRAARETGGLLMVHIGDTETPGNPPLTPGLLPLLEPGDMVSHVFTSHPGGILDAAGRLLPEARDAYERGVLFDNAHGLRNFSFAVAQRLLDQGVVPHTISTDLAAPSRANGPVFSLTETMSKCLALGFSLEDVVRMTTANPARYIRLDDVLGRLQEGYEADLSVLDVVTGQWEFTDSVGARLTGDKAIVPVLTIKGGEVVSVDWGPHPWGWLPSQGV